MYPDVSGIKSTKGRHSRNFSNFDRRPTPAQILQRYRDMEEEVDPELSAWRKANQVRMDHADAYNKTMIPGTKSSLGKPFPTPNGKGASILFPKPEVETCNSADEKLECNITSAANNEQLEIVCKQLQDVKFHTVPPPTPIGPSSHTPATFDLEAVVQSAHISMRNLPRTFPRLNRSHDGTNDNDETTDDETKEVVPLLEREVDMNGYWKYLSEDGELHDTYRQAKINGGLPVTVWIPHNADDALDPPDIHDSGSPHSSDLPTTPNSPSVNFCYSSKCCLSRSAAPEVAGEVMWECVDGERFYSSEEAGAHGRVVSYAGYDDHPAIDGYVSPYRACTPSDCWKNESDANANALGGVRSLSHRAIPNYVSPLPAGNPLDYWTNERVHFETRDSNVNAIVRGGYRNWSRYALDGAGSLDSRACTPPVCGRKFETTEEMYAFYANDRTNSCVVSPLFVSHNGSGDLASETHVDQFERSRAPSPTVSFSDTVSTSRKQSATSPSKGDSSISSCAAAGAGTTPASCPESAIYSYQNFWDPLMDDIENMLKKEPATDFNWTANVPIQFTNGQQTAVHVPGGSDDTRSCAASIEDNAESDTDTANVALSHEFSMESDSDALPRRHFNKELFGSNGWLDQTNTTKTGSKRRVSSGLKGLGQTVKAHIKDLTGDAKRARITTANPSIAVEITAALSLSVETQVKLYAELEYLIVTTANRFLMNEYYDGHVSDLSIRRLNKQWISKNRPGVPQFCFDQSTQRELIFANRQSVQFGGDASNQPMLLHTIFSNWKAVCTETSVRSFCLPDAAVRKHLRDIEGILELLQAPPSIMETMQTLAMRTREEILQVRAARTARASYGSGAPDTPSTPSTPSSSDSTFAYVNPRTPTASSISSISCTPRTPHSRRREASPNSCSPETSFPLYYDQNAPFELAGWTGELAAGRRQRRTAWRSINGRVNPTALRERGIPKSG
ncbi:hypothetical protein N7460_004641 [Penicillium canescens]|uniref:Uncharacterized protein n=1 Tax=Penicillium canescens TaxID=5083 RepID=A0AAD6N8Y7_PENCN|nr:hypothetical protein N7460_004641 [Penicillium canescens]KAJ6054761.1 hypothetical protein N7444_003859 [Penicillium canescens]